MNRQYSRESSRVRANKSREEKENVLVNQIKVRMENEQKSERKEMEIFKENIRSKEYQLIMKIEKEISSREDTVTRIYQRC